MSRQRVWESLASGPVSVADVALQCGISVMSVRSFLSVWARQGAVEMLPREGATPVYRRLTADLPRRSRDPVEQDDDDDDLRGINEDDIAWMQRWATRSGRRVIDSR